MQLANRLIDLYKARLDFLFTSSFNSSLLLMTHTPTPPSTKFFTFVGVSELHKTCGSAFFSPTSAVRLYLGRICSVSLSSSSISIMCQSEHRRKRRFAAAYNNGKVLTSGRLSSYFHLRRGSLKTLDPTYPFTTLELQNPSHDVTEQHNIPRSSDLEAIQM